MGMFYGHNQGNIFIGGYGYLYNWYAYTDANFAPTDWKVPTNSELGTLVSSIGVDAVAGGKMKAIGFEYWSSPNTGADNNSGFNGRGSGFRTRTGVYSSLNVLTYISTTDSIPKTSYLGLRFDSAAAAENPYLNADDTRLGISVRLLYTGVGTPSEVTDNDGNVIPVLLMADGNYWTALNWKCTTLDNGTSIPNVTNGTTWGGLSTLARCAYDNDEGNV